MNDEMFRLSLIDFMNENLLNDFVNNFFDYNLIDGEYIYMQYKIVNGNIVLNIYNNSDVNRFKAYIFTNDNFVNEDDDVYYINIDDCYNSYINDASRDKISLLGALLKEQDNNEKKKIINYLDDNSMKDILLKHFVV
mgnify:CR=1 FL=1